MAPEPTPTPTSVSTAPAPTPTPPPFADLAEEAAPASAIAFLSARASELASAIADAFWKMVALFTADGVNTAWAAGLTSFNQPVMSASGAAAVPPDVLRLARQATFGPTPEVINRIAELGVEGWLNEQFSIRRSTYRDLITWVPRNYCNSQPDAKRCWQNNFTRAPVAARFYADAVMAPDQLRQRVAFALSQVLVVSGAETNGTGGLASYQQILLDNAFGNYEDLLYAATLNGFMGSYLSMAGSSKWNPNENYGREFLQLFTMGANQLHPDGTLITDGGGRPVPNYTNNDVRQVARALTGWKFATNGGLTDSTGADLSQPMLKSPGHYDAEAKSFFGAYVPAGATQEASVREVVRAAFNHASTAPRISKILIQHLVKSNPSPAYVARVGAVFADDGTGRRGNLKAVVRAILLDAEARGDGRSAVDSGKLKEPAIALVAVARAVGLRTDGQALWNRDSAMGQPVFQAPSVFNFYPNDYPLSGSSTLVSPVSKLYAPGAIVSMQNLAADWMLRGDETRKDWNFDWGIPNYTGSAPTWAGWEGIGSDVDRLVAVVNMLMLNNMATESQKAALRTAALSITDKDPKLQSRRRAQALLYIAAVSPTYIVER